MRPVSLGNFAMAAMGGAAVLLLGIGGGSWLLTRGFKDKENQNSKILIKDKLGEQFFQNFWCPPLDLGIRIVNCGRCLNIFKI